MRRIASSAVLLLAASSLSIAIASPGAVAEPPPATDPAIASLGKAMRALCEKVTPSIVTVTSYQKVPEGVFREGQWQIAEESPYPGFMRNRVASGILISEDGTIICCRSPLLLDDGGFTEMVDVETSWGARYDAELLASEPTIDLAVIRLKLREGEGLGELRVATIGSVDLLEQGDPVFAAADPFGSSRTFAPGIIMALPTAACYQADLTGSFIHGSMAVSPGAVGGALVNGAGEVVGMIVPAPTLESTQPAVPETFVTYAMQIQTALAVGEALKTKRTHESPWLGFSVLSFEEMRRRLGDGATYEAMAKPEFGLYIDDLFDPSPASKAGVEVGDFVVEINGVEIRSVVDFQQTLYYFSGVRVPVRFFRDGEEYLKLMTIERRPPEANRP